MRKKSASKFLLAMLLAGINSPVQSLDAVATPAIDVSIFKDGEVESREFSMQMWHAKCQQIIKIKKRVCNLLSSVSDAEDKSVGSVLIATTDVGIPAMLISLPVDISKKMPISVDAAHRGKIDGHEVKVEYSNVIGPMVCDTTCKYMFPLDPKLVFILNASAVTRTKDSRGQ